MERIHKIKEKDWLIHQAVSEIRGLSDELTANASDFLKSQEITGRLTAAQARLRQIHQMPDNCQCTHKGCKEEFPQTDATVIVVKRVIRNGEFIVDDRDDKYIVLCPDCTAHLGLTEHLEEHEKARREALSA